jgi:hypothetical protein
MSRFDLDVCCPEVTHSFSPESFGVLFPLSTACIDLCYCSDVFLFISSNSYLSSKTCFNKVTQSSHFMKPPN